MQTPLNPTNHALNPFIAKHQKNVMGILQGIDRLRLKGSLRCLYQIEIFQEYLSQSKVLYKDFKKFACGITAEVCQRAEQLAQALKRPFTYLASSNISKEEAAQEIAQKDKIVDGLVAIFRCVEPCKTYKMRGNYQTKKLEPHLETGKCLHLYFYVQHPRFGLLHLRLQTWFPFLIHICLNGHQWLARQMDETGVSYRKADNRFTWIEDFQVAQNLADEQLRTDWVSLCEELRRTFHPLHQKIAQPLGGLTYYWSASETEFSTDVVFHKQKTLDQLFPHLVLHGILNLNSEQVMRFLGKKFNTQFGGEVVTDLRKRPEGVRIKHWVNLNSLKLYNSLNVLRAETTIVDPEDLKVFRSPETQPQAPMSWLPLRRGIADLYRRLELSRAANQRYLSSFASAHDVTPLAQEAATVCQPVQWQQRRYRALNPFNADEAQLLAAINRGEWDLKGFRNKDLRQILYGTCKDPKQRRSLAAKVTRRLALLRSHGLIIRIARSNRWQLTHKGRRILSALLAARQADTEKLLSMAA